MILTVAALLALFAVRYALTSGSGEPAPSKAAIVDQLASTDPNPEFIRSTSEELEAAGYQVDYYSPNQITVEFYRNLPTHGYKLIVLRSHTAGRNRTLDPNTQQVVRIDDKVSLFTNELYRIDTFVDDQRLGGLDRVRLLYPDHDERYFGITPKFVSSTMKSRFHGTTILLMGCDGTDSEGMARAFLSRGASKVIGWDGLVTAQHTDASSKALLHHLLADHMDAREAVAKTMTEAGADPVYQSKLRTIE